MAGAEEQDQESDSKLNPSVLMSIPWLSSASKSLETHVKKICVTLQAISCGALYSEFEEILTESCAAEKRADDFNQWGLYRGRTSVVPPLTCFIAKRSLTVHQYGNLAPHSLCLPTI